MEWKVEYAVGIDEVDAEHVRITECVSRIERAVDHGESWSAVHGAIGRLASVAKSHFTVEEDLMREHGYARLVEHADQHRQFYAGLIALQERSLMTDLSPKRVEYLQHWWDSHIRYYDQPCASHLLKRKVFGSS